MSLYEHVFIARPEISAQRAQVLIEEFRTIITAGGGSIASSEYWGVRQFAYPIKKSHKGHYMLLNIEADHAAISEMERKMERHDDVLRFLTLKVEAHGPHPSIQMQRREKSWEEEAEFKNSTLTQEAAANPSENAAPEGAAPEGGAPEGVAPEGGAPEGVAPEGGAPEEKEEKDA